MTDALVIIDMQNDYFSGGNMELSGIDVAAEIQRSFSCFTARRPNRFITFSTFPPMKALPFLYQIQQAQKLIHY